MQQGMDPRDAARAMVRVPSNQGHVGSPAYQGQVQGPYENSVTYSPVVSLTTLLGNVGGGVYAYRRTGGFWWTVLGVIVGGMAGNLTGRVLTTPVR